MEWKMYLDGEWVEAESKETIPVYNPADYSQTGTIPRGQNADVNKAVLAAKKAFQSSAWRAVKPHERGWILHDLAKKIREKKDELAMLETLDVGKPLKQSYADVEVAARYFEFYAGMADKILGDTIPIEPGLIDFTVREPVGVTAHIIPWNYPLQIGARSFAASIAAGNTVVLKPAEDTPVTALMLAQFFDELGVQKGVVNVVTGYGHEAGAALAGHKDINHLTFTGSVEVGKLVMKAAAENIVPVTLELGGKSPNIVFPDCDMEQAAEWVVRSIIQNAGQTCSAGSRLLVEASIHDTFVERVKYMFEELTIGPGAQDPDLGPILTEKQFNRIMSFIDIARNEATVVTGGERYTSGECMNGYFLKPTLITNVDPASRLAQEEIFGPVLTVFPFETEEEALKLANGTEYGLVTGIWTQDISRAHRLADQSQSGQVFVNNYGAGGGIQMPFGGYKQSGFGREKGIEALRNYTQLKNIAIKYQ
ncbi:MAG TPA: aldehyde dehydrogenase family protein [Bacillus sp. (in: firmicutes)]|nr:aldehyde dehydrogenase family protein [Bacillus sp. (in: firmicutes)]